MRFANIHNALYRRPWNLTPDGWLSMHEVFQSRLLAEAGNLDISTFVNQRLEMEVDGNGIAHIHISGTLGRRLSPIERSCGNTAYEQIEQELSDALSKDARGILLHVNSPGGMSTGNVETAQAVASAPLPTVAWVDELAASAAYALAASADQIIAAPSAQVGSIGTILPLVDTSAQWEQRGFKPAYITHTGGDLKDALWPPSFSDAHKAHLQEMVDDHFAQFRDHVLAHRQIKASAMRGQTFLAAKAKNQNLIDAIGTFNDAYAELLRLVDNKPNSK